MVNSATIHLMNCALNVFSSLRDIEERSSELRGKIEIHLFHFSRSLTKSRCRA